MPQALIDAAVPRLGNFVAQLARTAAYETWPSLCRLPAGTILHLREQSIGPDQRDLVPRRSKADLHRHLGGCLNQADQKEVAVAVWQALPPGQRDAGMALARPLLDAASTTLADEYVAASRMSEGGLCL